MIYKSTFPDVEIPEGVSLPQTIIMNIERYGDEVALVDHISGHSLTFRQVASQSKALATSLQERGLCKGDVVAIVSPNLPEFAVVLLGVTMAGGVLTLLNPNYTVKEISHQLRDSKAKYMVTIPALVNTVLATQHPLREIIVIGHAPGTTPLASLLNPTAQFTPVLINPKTDLLLLLYSSGTTSLPKGVCLSHYNLITGICQLSHPAFSPPTENDCMLGLLPFFHIYGVICILLFGLFHGTKVVTLPKFEPDAFLNALEKHKVTRMAVAPPVVLFLAKHPSVDNYDLSNLRDVMCGAAPLGQELAETFMKRLNCTLRQAYGMTEMSTATHIMPPSEANKGKHSSIGRLVPNMQMKVVDVETGEPVPPGSRGELLLKGPNIMLGYLNNPEATAATVDADGFLHTGDVGYIDDEGHCFIVDRCKELIKVQGFQVAPAELEDLLQGHPCVADCAVIGIPYAESEAPKAFIALKPNYTPSPELKSQIIAFVAQHTARYKHIKELSFMDAIPKSAAGKILRRELQAMARHPETTSKL